MPTPGTGAGPLRGVRVLDLSRVLAGPFCGSLLADLGADVVRVEYPARGDEVRSWAPRVDGVSAPFAAVNHSKRGVTIDLASAEGAEVFRRLVATADVLLENFRPGTLERLGLGRDALSGLNPKLIYCAIRAFPAATAGAARPGYEASMQAHSGIMSVTGESDGEPVRCGVSVVDLGTGMASVIAILAALRERDRTGKGEYVEPALLRTATNLLNYQIAGYTMAGVLPRRYGSGHEVLAPYRSFRCADGAVLIAAGNDRLWARLCKVLGIEGDAGELPYPALSERIAGRDAVNDIVGGAVAQRTRRDVLDALDAEGIPCAPVNDIAEYLSDETLVPARVLDKVRVGDGKEVALAGPLFAAAFLPHARSAPPGPGEHTDEVLRSLGYAEAEITALRGKGAIG
ncbi:MAG: CoA transferase [Burkholderiales bacterium]|nr:CoA transferase [Burkholderiales bacterium]